MIPLVVVLAVFIIAAYRIGWRETVDAVPEEELVDPSSAFGGDGRYRR